MTVRILLFVSVTVVFDFAPFPAIVVFVVVLQPQFGVMVKLFVDPPTPTLTVLVASPDITVVFPPVLSFALLPPVLAVELIAVVVLEMFCCVTLVLVVFDEFTVLFE